MRTIVRWDPFVDMEQMRHRMDRIFGDLRPWRLAPRVGSEIGYFPLDISETD